MSEMKKCSTCGNEYPATTEYFYKVIQIKCGFRAQCKKCTMKTIKESRMRGGDITSKDTKTCSTCGKTSPATVEYFYRNKSYRDGLGPICKACRKEYYQKNKEIINKRNYKYMKKYRNKKKDKKIIYIPVENKDRKKNNYLNSEKGRVYQRNKEHKRNARRKELMASLTTKQWNNCVEFFNNSCCYCGDKTKLTQDHFIPLSARGEYTHNNIVPACITCNVSKSNIDFFIWYPRQLFYSIKKEREILKYLNYKNPTIQQLGLF